MRNSIGYNRDYYLKHKKDISEKRKEKYRNDPSLRERDTRRTLEWRKKNPEKFRSYEIKATSRTSKRVREKRKRERLIVFNHYCGGKIECACCGEKVIELLTMDHVDNDGKEHRLKDKRAFNISLWLIKNNFPNGFQVLCFSCNWGKSFHGVCPHNK